MGGYADEGLMGRESGFTPAQAVVGAKQHMVDGLLVIRHDKNRPRLSALPEMRILVYISR